MNDVRPDLFPRHDRNDLLIAVQGDRDALEWKVMELTPLRLRLIHVNAHDPIEVVMTQSLEIVTPLIRRDVDGM